MPIKRLNHAVLYVRDAERSSAFYSEVLGFGPATLGDGGGQSDPGSGLPACPGLDERP